MALPVTISGAIWSTNASGNLGPFISSGGNVYLVGAEGPIGDPGILVFKATDPTSSFSEQDSANRPDTNGAAAFFAVDVFQDGDSLHIATISSTRATQYSHFDMSSDTWQDVDGTAHIRTVYTPTDIGTADWVSITVRSDGDIIILHPGEAPANKGQNVDSVYYSRGEGGTWTTGITVASTSTKGQRRRYGYAVMDSNDRCMFGYEKEDGSDFLLRALNSSNSLQTERLFSTTIERVQKGILYNRSGNKIGFQVYDALNSDVERVHFDEFTADDTNPTFSSEHIIADVALTIQELSAGYSFDDNDANDQNFSAYIASADLDIYLRSDGGGTTWGDENGGTAIRAGTVGGISANIFVRSGDRKYAFVYDDAGLVKYDEFSLGALPGGLILRPHHYGPLGHLIRR